MNSITDLLTSDNEHYDSQIVPGFVQGVVVENNNAKFKGMVKVEFTVWETGKNMCEWVRLMSPYTGKNYGTYLVPEIDEIVLVGFIGGSLKRPFLLGSLYPNTAKMVKDNFDKQNMVKRITTKGGMDILINEDNGKQKITLTTPKGSKILVDDEKECCTISDKAGQNKIHLDYKKDGIEISAGKTLKLSAGKTEISLDGNSGNVAIKGTKVAVQADNEINLNAKAALKMQAAQVQMKGQGQGNVQSSGQLALKGTITQIN